MNKKFDYLEKLKKTLEEKYKIKVSKIEEAERGLERRNMDSIPK